MASVGSNALRSGLTRSCGCLQSERTAASNAARAGRAVPVSRRTKARARTADPATWVSKSLSYGSWQNMIRRCTKTDDPRYPGWGGRGITVDPRWRDFANFLADMGERPPGMSLERKDNNGPYAPWNCVWATPHQQQMNTSIFKLTPDVVAEAKRLRASGLTHGDVGKILGLHRHTVSRALSGKGRSRNPDALNGIAGGGAYG